VARHWGRVLVVDDVRVVMMVVMAGLAAVVVVGRGTGR